MAMKAKHAFGSLADVQSALNLGKIDAYDILFLDGDTEPKIGWIDAKGEFRLVKNEADFSELEEIIAKKADASDVEALEKEVAAKADAAEVETAIAAKADVSDVEALEKEVATKVTAEEVETAVKAEIEAAVEKTKYEITDVPVGTLVDYRDKEIRICCPENAVFNKQNVGEGGDSNSYYMTFKTFAPSDDAVGYIEHLGEQVDAEILTNFNVDANGRRYQPTWLALAKYDEAAGVWNYYGKNSTANKYIGWDYQIDWYNADGVMIASDSVRINLSNESCHSIIEPYYVGAVKKEIETLVDEKIKEVEVGNEIIEF